MIDCFYFTSVKENGVAMMTLRYLPSKITLKMPGVLILCLGMLSRICGINGCREKDDGPPLLPFIINFSHLGLPFNISLFIMAALTKRAYNPTQYLNPHFRQRLCQLCNKKTAWFNVKKISGRGNMGVSFWAILWSWYFSINIHDFRMTKFAEWL